MAERNKKETENRIQNIAASPVIFGDKFLLIKRVKPPYDNYWSMVGGKIEFGEVLEEALLREIYEETGLNVRFISLRGVVTEILREDGKIKEHFIIWVFETQAETDSAVSSDEGEVQWFTKDELEKTKGSIIPSDYAMIQEFFLKRKTQITHHKSKVSKKGETYTLEFFGI